MSLIDCTECSKRISDQAHTCPNCGTPLSFSSQDTQRRALSEFYTNKESAEFFIVLAIACSIWIGIHHESWLIGFGAFFAVLFGIAIPVIGEVLVVVLPAISGYVGYGYAAAWWGQEAGYAVAIIIGFIVLGASLGAKDFLRDQIS